jgi:hypothetical protein
MLDFDDHPDELRAIERARERLQHVQAPELTVTPVTPESVDDDDDDDVDQIVIEFRRAVQQLLRVVVVAATVIITLTIIAVGVLLDN